MRDAVHLAVDRVPRLVLQRGIDVRIALDQVGVDRRDVAGVDQPQRGVAGGRHPVVLAGPHQLHHLVGGVADLDVDLAAGLLLERRHPVDGRIGGAVLGVAGPGEDVTSPSPSPSLASGRRFGRTPPSSPDADAPSDDPRRRGPHAGDGEPARRRAAERRMVVRAWCCSSCHGWCGSRGAHGEDGFLGRQATGRQIGGR